jgi:hypothetical protein
MSDDKKRKRLAEQEQDDVNEANKAFDNKDAKAYDEQCAIIDTEFGDNVVKELHKCGQERAHKIIRRIITCFPRFMGTNFGQCDNCAALHPRGDLHTEVEGYKLYTYTLCDDCTFWCKTCSVAFDESAEYKHESWDDHDTCKWAERDNESDSELECGSPAAKSDVSNDSKAESSVLLAVIDGPT